MTITKLGHCCLLIKEAGKILLTDPGTFTTLQNEITGIDAVLITHEHQDHFHIDSLKAILKNNPGAQVFTNKSVGKILDQHAIAYTVVEHGQQADFHGISIEGFGEKHAYIYQEIPDMENTGYMVADKFFYPGDAFPLPGKKVQILALPIAGPWMKLSEAIDFAKVVQPKIVFGVHDAILNPNLTGFMGQMLNNFLGSSGIQYVESPIGQEIKEIK